MGHVNLVAVTGITERGHLYKSFARINAAQLKTRC